MRPVWVMGLLKSPPTRANKTTAQCLWITSFNQGRRPTYSRLWMTINSRPFSFRNSSKMREFQPFKVKMKFPMYLLTKMDFKVLKTTWFQPKLLEIITPDNLRCQWLFSRSKCHKSKAATCWKLLECPIKCRQKLLLSDSFLTKTTALKIK